MEREQILDLIKLLSNIESVIDMELFRKEVPDWIIEKIEDSIEVLANELNKKDKEC